MTGKGDIQWDPATTPGNRSLMSQLDGIATRVEEKKRRQRKLAERFAGVLAAAAVQVEARMLAREAKNVREEDLRSALANEMRHNDELVLTEARMAVPGWTANLGGFDLAIVDQDAVVLGETKWADGNLYEAMWDILKLASATTAPRVEAAVAFYAAPTKQWHQAGTCAQLFEDRFVTARDLIWAFPTRWQTNLEGSSARPHAVPIPIELRLLASEEIEIVGKQYEVRALSVLGDEPFRTLENGWPHGEIPTESKPLK